MNESASPPLVSYSLAGPGTRLNGVYVIDKLIATGGMGQVFVGHAIETADKVAIKMIRPELARSDTYLALFRKEAAALHRAPHDAIVRYYLFTTDPQLGCPYLAMEFVEGEALADVLARGPLPLETVRVLQRRIASGLDVAHRAGVIHRDVSPDNIIIPENDPNRAKIIDFGIARDSKGEATVIGGEFAGKSNFVSPEQIGLFGGEVGPQTDVYSLGLTLVAALIGRPLDMEGLPADIVRKRSVVPDLSAVPAEMRPLLARMLEPDPKLRPSMAEVAAAADAAAAATPVPSRAAPPAKLRPKAALVAAALGALALGVGGFVLLRSGEKPAAMENAPAPRLVEEREPAQEPVKESAAAPRADAAPAGRAGEPAPDAAARIVPPPAHERAAPDQLSDFKLSDVAPPAPPAAPAPAPVAPTSVAAFDRPAAQAEPAPSTREGAFRDCPRCPEMLTLPGGVFSMGGAADPSEKPVHKVKVAPFAVGRFPVTGAQWRACVEAGGCGYDPGGVEDAPAHNLSWRDAAQYVDWLSHETGKRYRLLTEAEWEYAARGGSPTKFWWGSEFKPGMSACRGCGEAGDSDQPPKIGQFPQNGFGLQDVTGSAAQWVADCWRKNYRGAPTDGSAVGAPDCAQHVLRGGSWTSAPADLRVTNREFYDANVRYPGHGLRVGRDL
ncbi:bifunctional serine/threonine-protein kinase/formylglycine-generating enzyme family protein [Methylocella sp.]|uniref:bifunctional serine/threonine-protein kinase/formylglycine-generating enzyme family protein n=1 Tax=Methylocella sp. TaxID=1978226 RepID=UPI0035AF37B3